MTYTFTEGATVLLAAVAFVVGGTLGFFLGLLVYKTWG